MARGEDDLIYVVSRSYEYRPDGKRVTICTLGEDYVGEFARGVTTTGDGEASSADGSLIWPTAIALDKDGNAYVADEWLNRISIFTGDGAYVSKWGNPGAGNGEISSPSGLAFDQDDNLYLVDSDNHRVQKFTRDGKYLSQFGRQGSGDGEFNMPWGITIDQHGDIYVADWRNDRIQKFSAEGRFLMKFGTAGSGRRRIGPAYRGGGGPRRLHLRRRLGQRPFAGVQRPGRITSPRPPAMGLCPSGAKTSWTPTPRCGRSATSPRAWNGKKSSGARWRWQWTTTTMFSW